MNEARLARERLIWIAAVAVLATSLTWLAALGLTLLLGSHPGALAQALIVARTLVRVAATLAWHAAPVALAAALIGSAVALLVAGARERVPSGREMHRV